MIGNMIDNESVGYFATAGKFLDLTLFLPTVLTQTCLLYTSPGRFHYMEMISLVFIIV